MKQVSAHGQMTVVCVCVCVCVHASIARTNGISASDLRLGLGYGGPVR